MAPDRKLIRSTREWASLFEEVRIWPLRITTRQSTGLTLWSTQAGEEAVILGTGRIVLTFRTPERLAAFIDRGESNLAQDAGLDRLREALHTEALATAFQGPHWVSFPRVLRLLDDWQVSTWQPAQAGVLLNAINLMWDMAHTVGDAQSVSWLKDPDNALRILADELTFFDETSPSKLKTLNGAGVPELLRSALDRIEPSVMLVS